METCPDSSELEDLLAGRAPWGRLDRLAEHLEQCERCADIIRQLPEDDALASSILSNKLAEPDPEEDFIRGLINRLNRLQALIRQSEEEDRVAAPEFKDDYRSLLAPPQAPDEIGRLGNYRILGVIAKGGMGIVYRAQHAQLKRTVAVKMFLASTRGNRERRMRFWREAELVAGLQHPNIVPIFEVGDQEGLPYFAMELVEGGSLADTLRAAPLTARPAAELVSTLARAIQFAHERGIIHRDLKPANVLMVGCGYRTLDSGSAISTPISAVPKIADFGLARQLLADESLENEMPTESGAILGTPNYMAPEQTTGQSDLIGSAADVYALGAILYECLTGRPPFRAATVIETLDQVRRQDPVPPRRLQPKLSQELETICLKCLDKSPAGRYATAGALAEDLDRWLRGEPVQARPISPVGRVVKWARRNPAIAALSTALVVTVVASAVLYNVQLRSEAVEARRLKELAEAQYRDARDTLQKMLGRTNTYSGKGIPKLEELRREQQQDALAFYLKIADQHSDNPEVRFDVAQARQGAGLLQALLGQSKESLQNLRRAEQELAALAAEHPDRREYRLQHAHVLKVLGGIGSIPVPEAQAYMRRAVERTVELVAEEPDSVLFRSAEADARITFGSSLYTNSQPEKEAECEQHFRRAAAIYEQLGREQPDVTHHRYVLAKAYLNLSVLLNSTGRSPHEFHDKAAAILEQVYRDNPHNDVIESLAVLRLTWAYVQDAEGRTDDAIRDLDSTITMLTEALKLEPSHGIFRDRLYRTHGVRAQILDAHERFAESFLDWKKVIEYCASPKDADVHRLSLAMALARSGNHDQAINQIEDWNKRITASTPADQFLHCAAVYAIVLGAFPSQRPANVQSPPADVAGKHVERALHFLGKSQEAYGADSWTTEAAKISQDERFKALRDSPEFQRLITIEKK